jgi:hypothetical protein
LIASWHSVADRQAALTVPPVKTYLLPATGFAEENSNRPWAAACLERARRGVARAGDDFPQQAPNTDPTLFFPTEL